jgi:hypothetical protein
MDASPGIVVDVTSLDALGVAPEAAVASVVELVVDRTPLTPIILVVTTRQWHELPRRLDLLGDQLQIEQVADSARGAARTAAVAGDTVPVVSASIAAPATRWAGLGLLKGAVGIWPPDAVLKLGDGPLPAGIVNGTALLDCGAPASTSRIVAPWPADAKDGAAWRALADALRDPESDITRRSSPAQRLAWADVLVVEAAATVEEQIAFAVVTAGGAAPTPCAVAAVDLPAEIGRIRHAGGPPALLVVGFDHTRALHLVAPPEGTLLPDLSTLQVHPVEDGPSPVVALLNAVRRWDVWRHRADPDLRALIDTLIAGGASREILLHCRAALALTGALPKPWAADPHPAPLEALLAAVQAPPPSAGLWLPLPIESSSSPQRWKWAAISSRAASPVANPYLEFPVPQPWLRATREAGLHWWTLRKSRRSNASDPPPKILLPCAAQHARDPHVLEQLRAGSPSVGGQADAGVALWERTGWRLLFSADERTALTTEVASAFPSQNRGDSGIMGFFGGGAQEAPPQPPTATEIARHREKLKRTRWEAQRDRLLLAPEETMHVACTDISPAAEDWREADRQVGFLWAAIRNAASSGPRWIEQGAGRGLLSLADGWYLEIEAFQRVDSAATLEVDLQTHLDVSGSKPSLAPLTFATPRGGALPAAFVVTVGSFAATLTPRWSPLG